MKVLFSSPTYGPVDPQALRTQRAAIMHAAGHGVTWVGDVSPDRMGFAAARNTVAQAALETEADAVFWCDSDVTLPADAISRLVVEEKDFITGIYTQRYPPYWPLVAYLNPATDTFQWWSQMPTDVVAPVDGCGFGCVLTSTNLLRAVGAPWFAFAKYSEDFDFCVKAKRAGFQLFAHTGVLCGHLPEPVPVGLAHHQAQRDVIASQLQPALLVAA
jgi:hypothetical protein